MNVSVYHNYSIGITTYRITTRLTSVEYHNHILVESSDVTREKGGGGGACCVKYTPGYVINNFIV